VVKSESTNQRAASGHVLAQRLLTPIHTHLAAAPQPESSQSMYCIHIKINEKLFGTIQEGGGAFFMNPDNHAGIVQVNKFIS